MSPQEINSAALDYLDLIEHGCGSEAENVQALVRALDHLAYARHFAEADLVADTLDAPRGDYKRFRQLASERFPHFGFYNVVEFIAPEAAEAQILMGDAIDDIADIALALEKVAWLFEHSNDADALWTFGFSYDSHWRKHLRELQLFLDAFPDDPFTV